MLTNHNNNILIILSLLVVAVLSHVVSAQIIPENLQPHNQQNARRNGKLSRTKRMFALCPPEFQKIGNDCFYISNRKESWLDAHFECKDRNSKLAEPLKFADRRLRKYLQNKDSTQGEKWIGGMYNYQQKKWKWGYNGGEMKYQAFDDITEGTSNLQFHCTAMDPEIEYKWAAKECIERHYFICQHRMSFVNEKNRLKVYSKWNETYPNQIANEVEVYVTTNGKRSNINNNRKKSRNGANKLSQIKKNIKEDNQQSESSTPLPEYLPYKAYKNLETMKQTQPEVDIHPVHSIVPNVINQQTLKQRKRHSLKLTGNVDLGADTFKRKRPKQQKKIKNEVINESHNFHHQRHHPNAAIPNIPDAELKPVIETTTTTTTTTAPVLSTTIPTTTSTMTTATATEAPVVIIEESTLSELKRKLEEKAQRRERLKAKLAQLTPEERQAFLLMKQQRAEARKKGLSFVTS